MYTNDNKKNRNRKFEDFMMKCKIEESNLYYKNMKQLTEGMGEVLTQITLEMRFVKTKQKELYPSTICHLVNFPRGYKLMNLIVQYIHNGIE